MKKSFITIWLMRGVLMLAAVLAGVTPAGCAKKDASAQAVAE